MQSEFSLGLLQNDTLEEQLYHLRMCNFYIYFIFAYHCGMLLRVPSSILIMRGLCCAAHDGGSADIDISFREWARQQHGESGRRESGGIDAVQGRNAAA